VLIRVLEYLDRRGRSAYARWLEGLSHDAAAKVVEAVRDGDAVVILLGGSRKQDQQEEIAVARARWQDYRRRSR
jgi:hypothetical protein